VNRVLPRIVGIKVDAPFGFKSSGAPYRSAPEARLEAKLRRDGLRDLRVCINGTDHRRPKRGRVKCDDCLEVHRKNARDAYARRIGRPINQNRGSRRVS
jgi:hypothetical protein